MENFVIKFDSAKCVECGLCALDCISGCIKMEHGKPLAENMHWCSLCSHCLAICPSEGAIKHSGLAEKTRLVNYAKIKSDVYKEIAESRRSIRHYKDKEVPEHVMKDILEVASYSPTASNSMDVGYTVITDKEKINEIGTQIYKLGERIIRLLQKPYTRWLMFLFNKLSPQKNISRYIDRYALYNEWIAQGRNVVTHNAPVLIVLHTPAGKFSAINASIAAANITNYAHAQGLGTCYIGFINVAAAFSGKLEKSLQIPRGRKLQVALVMGYPALKYKKITHRPDSLVAFVR